jgi:hypothetical protein
MAFNDYRIAVGHNNAAGLVNIESITPSGDEPFDAPDGLGKYRLSPNRVVRGNGLMFHQGLPSTRWEFATITQAQVRYLMETYCSNGYSGFVTIRTQTDNKEVYANFNAVMNLTDPSENSLIYPIYENYIVSFTRMVAL